MRGNVRVQMADGSNMSLKGMTKHAHKERLILAYDQRKDRIVTALAINPRTTAFLHQFCHIKLSNKRGFCCVFDQMLLTERGWIKATELTPGTWMRQVRTDRVYVVKVDYTKYVEENIAAYTVTVPNMHTFALYCGVIAACAANCEAIQLHRLLH